MSAIERCRTAALGGHVARCENDKCAHTIIGYNSCRDRHCPKCQGAAAREWLAEREAELLPVPYVHVVYTLPAPIADIAYQNKRVIYDLLFKASAETTLTIAADPKHLGAKREVLRYLTRYTHRVAISNRRLVSADDAGVTFKCKDYRIHGPGRYTTMTLHPHEFIRRFLMHVLPKGLHRIRHYGLLANGNRADNIARVRELLAMAPRAKEPEEVNAAETDQPCVLPRPCPCCAGRMLIIETFAPGCEPKYRPAPTIPAIRIDTS